MLTEILVPIFVCVVLPIAIVWIVFFTIRQKNKNETQIILEALKSNPDLDPERLINSFRRPKRTPMQYLSRKLLRGCIFTLMGITFALLGLFSPEEDFIFGCWFFCGILSAVGIGFLVTYVFEYKNLDRMGKDYSSEENE